mgnify:FL=1|jgi:uncharacterized protein YpmB
MRRILQTGLTFVATLVSLLLTPAFAQAQQPESAAAAASEPTVAASKKTTLEPADVTTKANGQIELTVGRDSPIYAEFQGSPALTLRLREALQARGFELAPDAGSSKATLQFRGDMVLMGGPKFHKGVKAPIGETTEKALKLAKESGQVMTADVVQTTAGVALNAAALNASLNNFTRGLAISGIANALGDATGMRSWFNTAVAGDPRGICLSRCEDWNKVDQTVYLWVTLDSKAAGRKEIRILSKAISDTVAPEQVIAYAVDKAIELIRID